MDARYFVIIECRHLVKGCALKCAYILMLLGLMLFRNLSCLGTILCYLNTIGIVTVYAFNVCDVVVACWLTSMRQNGRPTINGRVT